MQSALDRNTLDRLTSLGSKQGHLTTEDLRASLPIESMSAEEIALIVVHLEESGIAVELEDGLVSPNAKPRPVPPQGAEIIPFPRSHRAAAPGNTRLQTTAAQNAIPSSSDPFEPEIQPRRAIHWVIAASGLLVLLMLGSLLVVWGG